MVLLDVLPTMLAVAIMCLSLAGLWVRPAWSGWIVFSIGGFGAADDGFSCAAVVKGRLGARFHMQQ